MVTPPIIKVGTLYFRPPIINLHLYPNCLVSHDCYICKFGEKWEANVRRRIIGRSYENKIEAARACWEYVKTKNNI